jgi:hypothetical protein
VPGTAVLLTGSLPSKKATRALNAKENSMANKCDFCGKPIEDGVYKGGHSFCSQGCAFHFKSLADHKGKTGIISGFGQMVDGAFGGSTGAISPDNMIIGAGKVTFGLGKLAGKGISAAAGAAAKASEERAARKEAEAALEKEHAAALVQQICAYNFAGASDAITHDLSELLPLVSWKSKADREDDANDELVQSAAGEKIMLGILQLTNQGDTANADFFQKQLDKTKWGMNAKQAAKYQAQADAMKAQAKELLGKGASAIAGGIKGFLNKRKEGV